MSHGPEFFFLDSEAIQIFQNNFKLIINDYNIIWDQIGGSDNIILTILTVFGLENCQLWTPITPDLEADSR